LPVGWQLIPVAEDESTPQRVATIALGGHPGWVAGQALSAFRFTGAPIPELLRDNAEHSLRAVRFIQRELGRVVEAQLLFPGAGRPHTAL
jgi:hypothetical protein